MYNSKVFLKEIIDELNIANNEKDNNLVHLFTRLGENFSDLSKNFQRIYGSRSDFEKKLKSLLHKLINIYNERPESLKEIDLEREKNPEWFLSSEWVSTMLYVDRYAGNLKGFIDKIEYLKELGINYIHLMPLLKSPSGENDGGYAVTDYTTVDERFGTMDDIRKISDIFRKNNMLLELDLVLNHTADNHLWAKEALKGEKKYQDYYYMYDNRTIPDKFEETLPEIFPELAPGNFTYKPEVNKWVFTVFNNYQWDLNYTNPDVFIEMLENLLFLANQGVDIVRLDAVAFLWKRIGTNSQNEQEAHFILQLFRSCVKIVAPGVLFKAEAIVQPNEIVKYLGDGDAAGKECDIAYNASFMVFLWDAIATKNVKLLIKGLENMPRLPKGTAWVNYIRCHDDIGLGFSDLDAQQVGYDPRLHRKFLVDYYTGDFFGSMATGKIFMYNPKNEDARISGSLASLAGLEKALNENNRLEIEKAVRKIILLHSVIISFGGIPLIYYGDELATVNDYSYLKDESKKSDNRWIHRPVINWDNSKIRNQDGTIENRVFYSIKKMIEIKKCSPEFNGENNFELVRTENLNVFTFLKEKEDIRTLVIVNFADTVQCIDYRALRLAGIYGEIYDKYTGKSVEIINEEIRLSPYNFLWISEKERRI